MDIFTDKGATLVTGGNGYVGGLIVEALLRTTNRNLVILARDGVTLDKVIAPVRVERQSRGGLLTAKEIDRVKILNYESIDTLSAITPFLKKYNITEIVHSAGCLEYFNVETLEKVNIEMTEKLLGLADSISVDRFIFISTAYSCGYRSNKTLETLHDTPDRDPTEYTRTKRAAEWCVATSGLPYMIVRPSIIIGNSESGRYSGKRYGLYQHWMGLERLLCDRYHEDMHLVASHQPVNFIHQDSFQAGFVAAYKNLDVSSILHLSSKTETLPTMRQIWELWLNNVARPKRVFYYPSLEDVPLKDIHSRQRAYLMFASVNLEIAAHYWDFATDNLTNLRRAGLVFHDATLETVTMCQDRFVNSSDRVRKFINNHKDKMSGSLEIIEANKPDMDDKAPVQATAGLSTA